MAKHASDIHIEPRAAETAVRIRVDGVLRDLQSIPRNLQTSLISRIKILSDMDITERRTPQDGRFYGFRWAAADRFFESLLFRPSTGRR